MLTHDCVQVARSSPHVACTLVQQHAAMDPDANLSLSTLPPDADFRGSYARLLDGFQQEGEARVNASAVPTGDLQLRLTDTCLVLDGWQDQGSFVHASMQMPDGCFA